MPLITPDLLIIFTLATDIAIVVTLVVLAIQVYLQRKETKYNTYEKLMIDYATKTLLFDHPDVLEIAIKGSGKTPKCGKYIDVEYAEKRTYSFFDLFLSLLERVWFGVPKKGLG